MSQDELTDAVRWIYGWLGILYGKSWLTVRPPRVWEDSTTVNGAIKNRSSVTDNYPRLPKIAYDYRWMTTFPFKTDGETMNNQDIPWFKSRLGTYRSNICSYSVTFNLFILFTSHAYLVLDRSWTLFGDYIWSTCNFNWTDRIASDEQMRGEVLLMSGCVRKACS